MWKVTTSVYPSGPDAIMNSGGLLPNLFFGTTSPVTSSGTCKPSWVQRGSTYHDAESVHIFDARIYLWVNSFAMCKYLDRCVTVGVVRNAEGGCKCRRESTRIPKGQSR